MEIVKSVFDKTMDSDDSDTGVEEIKLLNFSKECCLDVVMYSVHSMTNLLLGRVMDILKSEFDVDFTNKYYDTSHASIRSLIEYADATVWGLK